MSVGPGIIFRGRTFGGGRGVIRPVSNEQDVLHTVFEGDNAYNFNRSKVARLPR